MIVRVEPKDWSMYSVLLYFDKKKPDAEDGDARSYLAEHNLEPKRTLDTEVDGREFEVLSFGGCYIGQQHMKALSEIQRGAVERELLATKIAEYLRDGPDAAVREQTASMEDAQFQASVETLVQQFQCESSFGNDDEGYIQVTLDAAAVQESFWGIGGAYGSIKHKTIKTLPDEKYSGQCHSELVEESKAYRQRGHTP